MLYVISYDVTDDGRRHRLHEALKDFGRRVQYSVFECDLDHKALAELTGRIEFEIDPETDSCRFYTLCASCASRVKVVGKQDQLWDSQVIIV